MSGKTKHSESHKNGSPAKKQLKTNLSFWSPLNDGFALPDKASKCTWHKKIDAVSTPHSVQQWKNTAKIQPNILTTIGNTPLVKLNKIPQSAGLKCDVYVKCEFFNPGGSVKDRIAYRILEDAEKQGLLKPGYTIIEPSSGNTGIGMALAAAVKGYRCIIVMSEKMSNEKVAILNALGAEIVRTPVTADSNSEDGMFGVSHRLKKEIPNSIILDQYSNPSNPLAHYDTTAEEILDQCNNKVDMIIIGAGTGGTICGMGRKFKEASPSTVVVGADPYGSILAQPEIVNETNINFYEVEGIGYDFIPTILDRSVVDVWVKTDDQKSLPMARRLIREEGLLCGASSGSAMIACLEAAKDLKAGQSVVVILPDSVRNYMTKFISDQWMEARGFQESVNSNGHWWWNKNIAELKLEKVQTAGLSMTCDKLFQLMKKLSVDQIPVTDNVNNVLIGIVTIQRLMQGLVSGKVKGQESLEKIISRIYPKVDKSTGLGVASRILEKEAYVLIVEKTELGDKLIGILTPVDLLQYITNKKD